MRINEFASAADAMTLWKMISDNTWVAIAQQAEAEAKQKAERAAARKSASKRGTGKSAAKPVPPKRLPPPLQHVSAPVAKDSKSKADASNATSANSKQQPTVQNSSQPLPSAFQPQQPVQPITVGAVASQAIPNQANLASQTQFVRSTKD
jgi:hypothetical protein